MPVFSVKPQSNEGVNKTYTKLLKVYNTVTYNQFVSRIKLNEDITTISDLTKYLNENGYTSKDNYYPIEIVPSWNSSDNPGYYKSDMFVGVFAPTSSTLSFAYVSIISTDAKILVYSDYQGNTTILGF